MAWEDMEDMDDREYMAYMEYMEYTEYVTSPQSGLSIFAMGKKHAQLRANRYLRRARPRMDDG